MMPSLSATRILLNGLSLETPREGIPRDAAEPADRPPPVAAEDPVRAGLFAALRAVLARRAERRARVAAIERLGETSAHLLADIGLTVQGEPWTADAQSHANRPRPAMRRPVLRPAMAQGGLPVAAE